MQNIRLAAMAAGADSVIFKQAISTDLLPTVERVRRSGRPDNLTAQREV